MKKIVYLLLTVITSFVLSSYSHPMSNKGKYKINDSTSVNISITAKNIGPYELKANDIFTKACQSTIDANKLKTVILENLDKKSNEITPTRSEYILDKYGTNKNLIIKHIRNDILIKFISILLVIGLAIYLGKEIIKHKENWRLALIQLVFISLFILILQLSLYYILSYIFNNEFLTMKELINLLI